MATLAVIRHGEAAGNLHHRFIGQSQVELTEQGRRQAEAVATRLAGLPVTRIVTSDLVRAVSTIVPLAVRLGLQVDMDPRLREIDNGEWTGLLPEEIATRWPELWADYVAGEDVARPGGERWQHVAGRVIPLAEQLLIDDGTVVVSTHGGPALILALWAAGHPIDGNIFRGRLSALDNASLTLIESGPRLVAFNDVGHLAAAPTQGLPFLT